LYYGTGSGPYPGYNITPNIPFQFNAAQGTQLNFYFTYSYDGMERNNSANPHSIVVGDCATSSISENDSNLLVFYPNPASNTLHILSKSVVNVQIFTLQGKKVISERVRGDLDISKLTKGVYLIQLQENQNQFIGKLIVM
jgi:tRNA uridine 5-carbamoylmethylation protein Kti12